MISKVEKDRLTYLLNNKFNQFKGITIIQYFIKILVEWVSAVTIFSSGKQIFIQSVPKIFWQTSLNGNIYIKRIYFSIWLSKFNAIFTRLKGRASGFLTHTVYIPQVPRYKTLKPEKSKPEKVCDMILFPCWQLSLELWTKVHNLILF